MVVVSVNFNESLNIDLVVIFVVIESLVNGYFLEQDIKGLFVDFDIISN